MHRKEIYIIGASGHGRVVADIARLSGFESILFLDDDKTKMNCGIYDVVGTVNDLSESGSVFVAIGNPMIRQKIMEQIDTDRLVSLIHPSAIIGEDVSVDNGTVIMAGAVINPGATIGKGVIINTSCSVDHDCVIGDYSHISVGAHLAGTIKVGRNTWIGAGAIVSNNINICDGCVIGAGAVVIRDITKPGTYIGVPAKPHKRKGDPFV